MWKSFRVCWRRLQTDATTQFMGGTIMDILMVGTGIFLALAGLLVTLYCIDKKLDTILESLQEEKKND